jgi:hypothetical protein
MALIYVKDDARFHFVLMKGRNLAVIGRYIQGKAHIQLACKSFHGQWVIVQNENEAGMSKRMANFIKIKRHEFERIEYYSKHLDEIRQCEHGHMMAIMHRTGKNPKIDEFFCHCLLCGCEGGHSNDIDEVVKVWNEAGGKKEED